ncbi:MAG: hypothetical protein N2Z22_10360 [Turneriella sp.]|nr:hypothetical protein [Turneriella sp.]
MRFFSTLLKLLLPHKQEKRHNTDPLAGLSAIRLSRAEFLKIYNSMSEQARVRLFNSLNPEQQQKLLALLAENSSPKQEHAEEPEWQAEDFLPEKDESKVEKLRQAREKATLKKRFEELTSYAPELVAEALSPESPALAAVVLLQFDRKFASQVLKKMPELARGEVVRAMATPRQISSEVLLALVKKLSQRLGQLPQGEGQKKDFIRHAGEILKHMGIEAAQRITREVRELDAALAEKLETAQYRFEDLVHLSARDFRILFRELPDEQLWARALRATDQSQRKLLLGKLPVRRAGLIAAAMAKIKTTRLDSIDKARNQILKKAMDLAAHHKIRLNQGVANA